MLISLTKKVYKRKERGNAKRQRNAPIKSNMNDIHESEQRIIEMIKSKSFFIQPISFKAIIDFKLPRQSQSHSHHYIIIMDLSQPLDSLKTFLSTHSLQIGCILATTTAYHLYVRLRQPQNPSPLPRQSLKLKKHKSIRRVESVFRIPETILRSHNSLVDEVQHLYNPACKIQKVPHLILELGLRNIPSVKSPLIGDNKYRNFFGGQGFLPQEAFIYRGSFVLQKNLFHDSEDLVNPVSWLLAGPRKYLHFKPSEVRAAIVTCGGLCPGLNVVIRQIYSTLVNLYGCPEVWGVKFGYMGLYSGPDYWFKLYQKFVRDLQFQGGTIFGSSRGGFDIDKIINALVERGINQLYIIGGDGTHRGISVIAQELKKRRLEISIVGIPKTIDNDIPIIDKSFGFQTAVAESIRAIRSAYVESIGVDYGIGLVRLMGRDAGFIAMQATNASRDVNICIIPEFPFDIYGEQGLLQYIHQQLKSKRHLVIVVAEGAGNGVRDLQKLKQGAEKDQSGNIKLPDIGVFLKTEIVRYCKEKGMNATLKYIDPAYMIRTVPANSYDRKLCSHLASSAVHGAMAGFTAFTVGHINQNVAMIPISSLGKPNRVTKQNRAWQRVLAYTSQPSFLNQDPK